MLKMCSTLLLEIPLIPNIYNHVSRLTKQNKKNQNLGCENLENVSCDMWRHVRVHVCHYYWSNKLAFGISPLDAIET